MSERYFVKMVRRPVDPEIKKEKEEVASSETVTEEKSKIKSIKTDEQINKGD